MRWAILAALLVMEASAVLLVVQILARCFWVWVRWPLWIVLVVASLAAADAAITRLSGQSVVATGDWEAAKQLVRLDAPYPTLRLYVVSLVGAAPVLLVLFGLLSLLRWKRNGLKLIVWPIGWQSSLTGLAISFGLLLVLLFENDNSVWRMIQAREKESQTLAQSIAPAPCSDDENAAPIFVELGAAKEISQKSLPDPTDDIERLHSGDWTEYLTRNRDLAEKIRQAASKPHCRFDIDRSKADSPTETSEIEHARECLRLLYWEARRALLDGNVPLGLANAVALRRSAELLAQDPGTKTLLLATAAEHLAGDVVEHLLFVHQPTRHEISQLVNHGFEFHKQLPANSVRQHAEQLELFAKRYSGQAIDANDLPLVNVPLVLTVLRAERRLLYAADDDRALPQLFDEFRRRTAVPYGKASANAKETMDDFTDRLGGAGVTDAALARVNTLAESLAQADMKRRLVDFALGVARKGLVDQVRSSGPYRAIPPAKRPIDLFDNSPLKALAADGGVVLYSVDRDGKDDQGTERLPKSTSWDMTFCFGEAYKARRLSSQQSDLDRQADLPPSDLETTDAEGGP